VHDALTMDTSRNVKVSESVETGSLLLRIPSASLLTLGSAERAGSQGKHLFAVVAKCKAKLHFPADDVVLALFLAMETANPVSPYKSYVATLPHDGSHKRLPRFWSEEERQNWLAGSPLAERSRADQAGVRTDYSMLAELWKDSSVAKAASLPPLPSLEGYSEALAMVSSRAFGGLGGDGLDALVPLLDLLNHRRGTGEKKDVTYARTDSGDVEVRAAHAISKDAVVWETYGAKGNAQLLSCYGFCLPQNIEPDGSSNDFVDLTLPDDLGTVQLQVGPKAYTYPSFVKAVDLLRQPPKRAQKVPGVKRRRENELDADLDAMDDVAVIDLGDLGEEGGEEEELENDPVLEGEGTSEPRSECEALEVLKTSLVGAIARYSQRGPELVQQAKDNAIPDQQRYSAMLLCSELRTLEFFLYVTRLLQTRLEGGSSNGKEKQNKKKARPSIATPQCSIPLTADDTTLLDRQAQELVTAYVMIRHGKR